MNRIQGPLASLTLRAPPSPRVPSTPPLPPSNETSKQIKCKKKDVTREQDIEIGIRNNAKFGCRRSRSGDHTFSPRRFRSTLPKWCPWALRDIPIMQTSRDINTAPEEIVRLRNARRDTNVRGVPQVGSLTVFFLYALTILPLPLSPLRAQ